MATTLVLPLYVDISGPAIAPPPSYSVQPSENEETVAFTPRLGNSLGSRGNFTRQWPQATLILNDQDEESRLPTYGRNGRISGELGLKNTNNIVQVTVKLYGQMSLSLADSGSIAATLISETQVLWKHRPNDDPVAGERRCPSLLPIYFRFPQSYEVEGKHWTLPPTFEATFLGIPALFVRCMYTLSVTITRTRSYHLASWTTNKTYVTMVNFRPRSRPNRPVIMLDSVFASIKPDPDEWLQVVASMNVRAGSGMRPIECHLLLPSVQAYPLAEMIPFHLQLCSSLKSLRELLPPTSTHLQIPGAKGSKSMDESLPHAIRLSIARQIVVEVNGRRRFRTYTVGLGKMWPVPPAHSNNTSWEKYSNGSTEADGDVCLDWQGEVRCWGEVTCGGFSTSSLIVKDFLVLSLTPHNPRSSFLIPLQVSHPIRLVTDSWTDVDELHPGDR